MLDEEEYDMVTWALDREVDPVASLFARPAGQPIAAETATGLTAGKYPGLGWATGGFALDEAFPASGPVLTSTVLRGLGLPTDKTQVTVSLGGKDCPVTAASADGSQITITIPAGATTGFLAVTYGHLTHAGLTFTVL